MPINDSLALKCKVFRIKKVDKAYIIDIFNNDKKYTIISLKTEKQNIKKIGKGKTYEFILLAYSPFRMVGGNPGYRCYRIDGIDVIFKTDFKTGRIVTTPNLKGLHYQFPK